MTIFGQFSLTSAVVSLRPSLVKVKSSALIDSCYMVIECSWH